MDNEQVVGLHMEVQEDGTLPVRVVYIENNDVMTDNQPLYIIPNTNADVENETDSLSPPYPWIGSERGTPEPPDPEDTNDAPEPPKNQSQASVSSRKRAHSDDENEGQNDDDDDGDDGRLCPICYDNWTSAGEHRLCSLKCGHLFGLSCVQRWLNSQVRKSCPTCKKHVSRHDIRYIYAKKVIAVDTHIVESLRKQLVDVNCEKLQLHMELNMSKCRESLLEQEVGDLKKQLAARKSTTFTDCGSGGSTVSQQQRGRIKLYKDKSLEISSGCRVFDVNLRLNSIAVSSKSNNPLFAGFGIRKVAISDYKLRSFLPLHSDAIRDVAFHPENNSLLTASLDRTCKIVDYTANGAGMTVCCGVEVWSCCWDCADSNVFYAGTRQGTVLKYDKRHGSSFLATYQVAGDMSPVVSVASPTKNSLISCKLSSLWHFNQEENTPTRLPIEGPFISLRCEPLTKQLLVSARPTTNFPYTRHLLFTVDTKTCQSNTAHTFAVDGKPNFLSRACFLMGDGGDFLAAHNENEKCVVLWSVNTGAKVGSVAAHEPVLDLCGFKVASGGERFLVSLTEKKLDFFKFTRYNE